MQERSSSYLENSQVAIHAGIIIVIMLLGGRDGIDKLFVSCLKSKQSYFASFVYARGQYTSRLGPHVGTNQQLKKTLDCNKRQRTFKNSHKLSSGDQCPIYQFYNSNGLRMRLSYHQDKT